jgi:hypothetical protein
MNAENADRRRPAGGDVDKDCAASIARTTDDHGLVHLDEAVAELVAGQDAGIWPVFGAGYCSGYAAGHRAGYREGLQVLDEAGALLASLRPARAIDAAAARQRRTTYARKPETAAQLLARARDSWAPVERAAAEGQQGRRAG